MTITEYKALLLKAKSEGDFEPSFEMLKRVANMALGAHCEIDIDNYNKMVIVSLFGVRVTWASFEQMDIGWAYSHCIWSLMDKDGLSNKFNAKIADIIYNSIINTK